MLAVDAGSYVMELLQPALIHAHWPRDVEAALLRHAWHRRPVREPHLDFNWRAYLRDRLDVEAPLWTTPTQPCLNHGDPTASNTMRRPLDRPYGEWPLILCDPIPVRPYMPEVREEDMAKILQTVAGWEQVVYGWQSMEPMAWEPPDFAYEPEAWRAALFWLGVSCARIAYREERAEEPRERVLLWCDAVRSYCHEVTDS